MSRWIGGIVGVLALLVGAVWTLQGANVIAGSFMTGSKLWLGIGLVLVVGGVWLLGRTLRRAR